MSSQQYPVLPRVPCYAKMVGPNSQTFYLTKPSTTFGRRPQCPASVVHNDGLPLDVADLFISNDRSVSRKHFVIYYNISPLHSASRYELKCFAKNGMFVNGQYTNCSSPPLALASQSLLTVGNDQWYFLLPQHYSHATAIHSMPIAYISPSLLQRAKLHEEELQLEIKTRFEKLHLESLVAKGSREDDSDLNTIPEARLPSSLPLHELTTATAPLPSQPPADLLASVAVTTDRFQRVERDAIRDSLMFFGWHRWDTLEQKFHDLVKEENIESEKSLEEIKEFCLELVAAVCKVVNANVSAPLKKIIPEVNALLALSKPSALGQAMSDWGALHKHGEAWARRLVQLNQLHQSVLERGTKHLLDNLMSKPRGRLPAVWWKSEHDLDLLIGFYKHGHSNFDDLKEDPVLAFEGSLRQWRDQHGGAGGVGVGNDREDDSGMVDDDGDADDVDDDDGDDNLKSSLNAGLSGASGGGSTGASSGSFALQSRVSRGKTTDGWPISLAVVGRFRQLLKVMQERDKKEAKTLKRKREIEMFTINENKKPKGGSDKPPALPSLPVPTPAQSLALSSMSSLSSIPTQYLYQTPNEYRDDLWRPEIDDGHLILALMQFGLPRLPATKTVGADHAWRFFIGRYRFRFGHFSVPFLEARFSRLLHDSNQLLDRTGWQPELMDGLNKETLMRAVVSWDDRNDSDVAPLSMDACVAYHLLQLLQHFDKLRRHVMVTERSIDFNRLPMSEPPHVRGRLPPWWRAGVHDRQLLEAVNKHGLCWRKIDEDFAFPFKSYGIGLVAFSSSDIGNACLIERWKECVNYWLAERERQLGHPLATQATPGWPAPPMPSMG